LHATPRRSAEVLAATEEVERLDVVIDHSKRSTDVVGQLASGA
jgi:hypothetical protein